MEFSGIQDINELIKHATDKDIGDWDEPILETKDVPEQSEPESLYSDKPDYEDYDSMRNDWYWEHYLKEEIRLSPLLRNRIMEWHGGQWTPTYSVGSSDESTVDSIDSAITELESLQDPKAYAVIDELQQTVRNFFKGAKEDYIESGISQEESRKEDIFGSAEYVKKFGADDTDEFSAEDTFEEGFGEPEPDEENDIFFGDERGKTVVSYAGKVIGTFGEEEEARNFIRNWMEKEKYWPNVWFVSDHGNMHLVTDLGGEEKDKSLPENMVKDYEERARSEREAGATIEINEHLPYVAIKMSDGSEYFFQGEEASMLLDEVPDNINEEDFILALAQGW